MCWPRLGITNIIPSSLLLEVNANGNTVILRAWVFIKKIHMTKTTLISSCIHFKQQIPLLSHQYHRMVTNCLTLLANPVHTVSLSLTSACQIPWNKVVNDVCIDGLAFKITYLLSIYQWTELGSRKQHDPDMTTYSAFTTSAHCILYQGQIVSKHGRLADLVFKDTFNAPRFMHLNVILIQL